MTIKVIKEPDIHLTEDELLKYRRAYNEFCRHHVSPPSFETFLRNRSFTEAVAEARRLTRNTP